MGASFQIIASETAYQLINSHVDNQIITTLIDPDASITIIDKNCLPFNPKIPVETPISVNGLGTSYNLVQ